MKYLLSLLVIAVSFIAVPGCRMNNGDIGVLYGIWTVTEVKVDGQIYDGWKIAGYDDSFFQFQNNICFITRTNDLYDSETQVCTWEWKERDTEIALNFTHHDNENPVPHPGGVTYSPPFWLLLDEPGIYTFDVEWKGDKTMVWRTVNAAGQALTYCLKKTY